MTKTFKITGDRALDAAKDFAQGQKQIRKDFALLQMKQARETNDFMAQWKKTFRGYFRIIAEGVLDDPDEAFSKSTHAVDLSYVDHGDVFIFVKPAENSEMESDGDESSGESSPPRIIVN
jgi:hypothetical protein